MSDVVMHPVEYELSTVSYPLAAPVVSKGWDACAHDPRLACGSVWLLLSHILNRGDVSWDTTASRRVFSRDD